MNYFDKTYHPPGTAPGTLVSEESVPQAGLPIRLIDYTGETFVELELGQPDDCLSYLDRDSVTWIHLQGSITAETVANVGNLFGLHTLALEDVLNSGQRPKIEEYTDSLFVVMSIPALIEGRMITEQVSLFLGKNYVISFHNGDKDPFDPLRIRLRKTAGRIRHQQADYLLYSILDLVIDQGYPILEGLGETLETIEEALLDAAVSKTTLASIHRIRRELLLLRRNLWPQREVINYLLHGESELIHESSLIYFRDCYDHTIQILDLIENYREMASSMIDIYLSSVSHRLNEIMRVLTMIATIFIPLTFVAGLYGMNFSHPDSPWAMPELHWYYGYPLVLGAMLLVVVGMVLFFKRRHWL